MNFSCKTFTCFHSKAIIGYLVGKYGKDDSLYPKEAKKRAVVDRLLYFDMSMHERFRAYAVSILMISFSSPNSVNKSTN